MTARPYTVREYLHAPLAPGRRTAHLGELTVLVSARPLEATVADLRTALRAGIDIEAHRRLHILISHLYHRHGATIPETRRLRAEVGRALARRGTTTHV
ncbi:hypothetical protein [Streptomyces sp. NRRL F-5123]|uniref:hypothetical protein n=1 Tax=Streptomyces sp. NRRL F-5123 TaxID=1463856 RepID=UPI0004E1B68A|nr:hypothetical protein [Streptomyces sp. NRRL F-5123]